MTSASKRLLLLAMPCAAGAWGAGAQRANQTTQSAFQAENDAAMRQMMAGMSALPSGDVDRDFAMMMIPHHQGGIDMAMAELRHGRDDGLRGLARNIIAAQQREIAVMRAALGRLPLPADWSMEMPGNPALGTP